MGLIHQIHWVNSHICLECDGGNKNRTNGLPIVTASISIIITIAINTHVRIIPAPHRVSAALVPLRSRAAESFQTRWHGLGFLTDTSEWHTSIHTQSAV